VNKKINEDELDQILIKLVQEKKPSSVQQLIGLTKSETTFNSEQKIVRHILRLESQGKITLKEPALQPSAKLGTYLKTRKATWYWVIIVMATATALTIFTIQEDTYPLIYIRYVLGAIFVLFLPGFSLIKAFFPEKELDSIERTALSLGMSLALIPITVLILNYTSWGIRTTPITLTLLALTTIFATAAIIREYQRTTIDMREEK
jgi:hypothetical protein